ncbi:hypothetical protein MHZ92_06190 [Sporosarcina sp. ACRSL]|uniref:hypothetical protein n=1 Tax=Sporosarcina sp. ACRSL TaxID=2918215 RepID=UPI001EF49D3C|nr:hypothetical protein [Sporosarcina sp. ACRSL]MCG7343714.1 hypothetical protein [Sporosarcina sp. ACRSL]
MKKLIGIISLILLIIVLLLVSPYNLVHYFTAENKVSSLLADPAVRLEILDDDSKITSVKYLGNNMYRVVTKESAYVMEIITEKSTQTIEVFEHKQHVKRFKF